MRIISDIFWEITLKIFSIFSLIFESVENVKDFSKKFWNVLTRFSFLKIHRNYFQFDKEVGATVVQDPETGIIRKTQKASALMLLSRIFFQAFTLTFLAEWGDRSQLTTIILAAREVRKFFSINVSSYAIFTTVNFISGRLRCCCWGSPWTFILYRFGGTRWSNDSSKNIRPYW